MNRTPILFLNVMVIATCGLIYELLAGTLSAPLLFFSFARFGHFQIILFIIVFAIGALVGLEIPLLMRILKDNLDFKELVSRVLTFDYIGALAASLLFPICAQLASSANRRHPKTR
jgi:predicted membrane-bound spermidine synthase